MLISIRKCFGFHLTFSCIMLHHILLLDNSHPPKLGWFVVQITLNWERQVSSYLSCWADVGTEGISVLTQRPSKVIDGLISCHLNWAKSCCFRDFSLQRLYGNIEIVCVWKTCSYILIFFPPLSIFRHAKVVIIARCQRVSRLGYVDKSQYM